MVKDRRGEHHLAAASQTVRPQMPVQSQLPFEESSNCDEPGRFHFETEAFFSDMLSDLTPRNRVLHQCVFRRNDAVVGFRVGQVPYVALEFLVGIAAAAVAAPGVFLGRLEAPVVLAPLVDESRS